MPDTPLNPDALKRARWAADIAIKEGYHAVVDASVLQALLDLAVALPEVTSVEELHQLPSGSIIRASGGSAWKKFGSGWGAWFKAGDSLDYEASIVALPARVLYRPEVKP